MSGVNLPRNHMVKPSEFSNRVQRGYIILIGSSNVPLKKLIV